MIVLCHLGNVREKSSGVREFCPNSKFPDKRSAGLTKLDCI